MKRALLVSIALIVLSVPALASEWVIDPDNSEVTFVTDAFGTTVNGRFSSFGADITLDPNDLTRAHIEAYVETGSVETGTPDIDDALLGEEGFDPQGHMRATFVSNDVHPGEGCGDAEALCLIASGDMVIRGVSKPLDLPFALSSDGTRAVADGSFVIRRTDYNIGTLEWELAGWETTVHLHIEATSR